MSTVKFSSTFLFYLQRLSEYFSRGCGLAGLVKREKEREKIFRRPQACSRRLLCTWQNIGNDILLLPKRSNVTSCLMYMHACIHIHTWHPSIIIMELSKSVNDEERENEHLVGNFLLLYIVHNHMIYETIIIVQGQNYCYFYIRKRKLRTKKFGVWEIFWR